MRKRTRDFWESEEVKVHGDVSSEFFHEYADRVMRYVCATLELHLE